MHGTRNTRLGTTAGLLLTLSLAVVVAACGASGTASPSPSAPATPSAPASEAPSQAPSESPAGEVIDLDTVDENDVSVVIDDAGDVLTGAASGPARDGMSVRWGDVLVENVDEDTLRVTWVGLPVDTQVQLAIAANGEGYALDFVQPAPPANSDAVGFDRVLVLDFADAVRAQDVTATFATEG